MPNINVVLTPGTLPQGYCFSSLQQYYNDIIGLTLAQLPGTFNLFNYGPNVPDPADQDKPWIRTDGLGNFDRVYTFSGVWLSPHPTPPSGSERRIWVGTEADLWSYDGGDGTDPATATDTTGSMWAIDTTFAFKFPIGVGTNPVTYGGNPATAVAVNGTGGQEQQTLVDANIPPHTHDCAGVGQAGSSGSGHDYFWSNEASGPPPPSNSKTLVTESAFGNGSGAANPFSVMPPYVGVYFIKRSSRKYFTVT